MSPDMMGLFWRCADCPETTPTLNADDLAGFTAAEVEAFRKAGLLEPGETAGYVTCRECADDHVAKVEHVSAPGGKSRFFAVCPQNGRFEVPRDRLFQWYVSFDPVLAAVMAALGATGDLQTVAPGRVWKMGRATLGGRSRPLWAVRGMAWPDAAIVARDVPKGKSPVVFVFGRLPTDGLLDVPPDSIIELRGVVSLQSGALAVAIDAVDGQISVVASEPQPKKAKKRSSRAAAIDALKKALREHIIIARDFTFNSIRKGKGTKTLPRPTQEQLARKLKLSVSSVSRSLSDPSDRELPWLWNIADNVDQIMQFKG